MTHYNFDEDVAREIKNTREVAKYLEFRGIWGPSEIAEGFHPDWDVKTKLKEDDFTSTFEIKEDFRCESTGNIAIEFESRGKPSGINITKADYYLYKIHQPDKKISLYLIPTSDLKKLVEKRSYLRIVKGGDFGSNTLMYLFPFERSVKDNWILLGFMEK